MKRFILQYIAMLAFNQTLMYDIFYYQVIWSLFKRLLNIVRKGCDIIAKYVHLGKRVTSSCFFLVGEHEVVFKM